MPFTVQQFRYRVEMRRPRELGRGRYEAKQVKDEIIVTAAGETPTPNYRVWLKTGPERIFPPIVELWWMRPPGMQPQVLTRFEVHLTIHVGDQKPEHIQLRDADGLHRLPVEQVDTTDPEEPVEPERLLANSFRLTLGDVPVTYAATSFIGEPIMSIGDQHFIGDQLHIEETTLGQQVSVITEQIPDLKTVTFTLILPPVLLAGTKPAEVEVPGVTATHHTTIAGPPLGQGTTYEQAMLRGIAEFIVA